MNVKNNHPYPILVSTTPDTPGYELAPGTSIALDLPDDTVIYIEERPSG